MHPEFPGPVADAALPARGGLLSPILRRDLTDLNAQYLDLGVASFPAGDPRFGWADAVGRRLSDLEGGLRERMASAPFALFQLQVPLATPSPVNGIADLARGTSDAAWAARCTSFAHQAAFFARRLCDSVPLAANVVLDLTPETQAALCALRPSEIAGFAEDPGFLRPRWPGHQRFWRMLEAAARADSAVAMQWAHCVGVCLLGADDSRSSGAGHPVARRKLRR
jgi:hypothetical protein